MDNSKRQKLQLALAFFIGVISIVLLFFPDIIGGNKYSFKEIVEKKREIEAANETASINGAEISRIESSIGDEKRELDKLTLEKSEIKVERDYYELDIPSLLISLEKEALANNVEVAINLNEMSTTDGSGSYTHEEESSESEESSEDNDTVDQNEEENEEEETTDEENFESEVGNDSMIEDLSIATIPLDVKGEYLDVRSYIRYLDEIGMIEPSSVNLKSKEDKIEGEVTINVFFGRLD